MERVSLVCDLIFFGTRHTVPCENLNQLGFHGQHLFPANSGLLLADKDPVLGVEVSREPGRHGYTRFRIST